MAAENKQLKNDFLGPNMTTTTTRPYISTESKNFAASMLHQKTDEVDNAKEITFKSSFSETNFRQTVSNTTESRFSSSESYTISSSGVSKRVEITKENGEQLTSPMKSFIQQRVERLYGPGALAQGFFNQKRYKLKSQSEDDDPKVLTEKSPNCPDRLMTPRKCTSVESENRYTSPNGEAEAGLSLPVLRHLRPEFRAQLPILSPKKTAKSDVSPQKLDDIPRQTKTEGLNNTSSITNGVSVIILDDSKDDIVVKDTVNGVRSEVTVNGSNKSNGVKEEVLYDGHYFLELKRKETERLLAMSHAAEKELEELEKQDVSEEVLGLLRSAAGKARLLATQKMQQFEGLCYNNINRLGSEQFPTTRSDLRGFWDMVCLQVRHVDAVYEQLAAARARGWTEIEEPKQPVASISAPASHRVKPRAAPVSNEKARAAAEKRDAERRAMLEHRRRLAREKQLAARVSAPGTSRERDQDMSVEGSQEVEIFVGKTPKPCKVAPTGDCRSGSRSEDSFLES